MDKLDLKEIAKDMRPPGWGGIPESMNKNIVCEPKCSSGRPRAVEKPAAKIDKATAGRLGAAGKQISRLKSRIATLRLAHEELKERFNNSDFELRILREKYIILRKGANKNNPNAEGLILKNGELEDQVDSSERAHAVTRGHLRRAKSHLSGVNTRLKNIKRGRIIDGQILVSVELIDELIDLCDPKY